MEFLRSKLQAHNKSQPSVLRAFKIQKIYKIRSTEMSFFVEACVNRLTTG